MTSFILPPENDEGNQEYKWKLINPSPDRFQHLVTQLLFRLNEGGHEAIYDLGVEDNGNPKGLSHIDLKSSLKTLKRMAQEVNATTQQLRVRPGNDPDSFVSEILIRKFFDFQAIELRCAVVGNVDSGKSTLSGVLSLGTLDNGRGLARISIFRHNAFKQSF